MHYIKSFKNFSLLEGVINLTPLEYEQFESIFDNLWRILKENDFTKADKTIPGPSRNPSSGPICNLKAIQAGKLNYEYKGGGEDTLSVYIGDPSGTEANGDYGGYYSSKEINKSHNLIFINKVVFSGQDVDDKEKLRSIIYHEFIHAKDPMCNKFSKFRKDDTSYSNRNEEISAHKSQFFNLIENRINQFIKDHSKNLNDPNLPKKLKKIENVLGSFYKSFVNFGSGSIRNKQIVDFIERYELELEKEDSDTDDEIGSKILELMIEFLRDFKVSDRSPDGQLGPRYKKFLSDLYTFIMKCQDRINKMIEGTNLEPIDYKQSGKNFIYMPSWLGSSDLLNFLIQKNLW